MYEVLIAKYTGRTNFDLRALHDARPELAEAIHRTASELTDLERSLRQRAQWLRDVAEKIRLALDAGTDRRGPTLNSLGELQASGPDLDRVVALRQASIDALERLVRIAERDDR